MAATQHFHISLYISILHRKCPQNSDRMRGLKKNIHYTRYIYLRAMDVLGLNLLNIQHSTCPGSALVIVYIMLVRQFEAVSHKV